MNENKRLSDIIKEHFGCKLNELSCDLIYEFANCWKYSQKVERRGVHIYLCSVMFNDTTENCSIEIRPLYLKISYLGDLFFLIYRK